MIHQLSESDGIIAWLNDSGEAHCIQLNCGTYIFSDIQIFVLNEAKDKAVLYDSNGTIVATIQNNDTIYLMYLKDHFKYGLTIVASVKEETRWKEYYLYFNGTKFVPGCEMR